MSFKSSLVGWLLSNFSRVFLNSCSRLINATLPERCALCSAAASVLSLCAACEEELPWLPLKHCPQCALPTTNANVCGACLSPPPRFDSITAAFVYEWPLAPLIQRYKYGGNLPLARLFARALNSTIARDVDLIIPMPLAPLRLAERGFNQALEIARIVSGVRQTKLAVN